MLDAHIIKPHATPYLEGIALDRPGSLRDQLVSVEFMGGGQSRLYYSLYNPQPEKDLATLISSDFVRHAHCDNPDKKELLIQQFKDLKDAVTERDKNILFETDLYKPALTFCFDLQDNEATQCSIFASFAKINGYEDFKTANKLLHNSPHKKQLQMWKRFVLNETNKGSKSPKKDIGFEHVVQKTTLNIQNIAYTISTDQGIECLHRRKTPSSKPNDSYLYIPTSNAQTPKAQQYDWTLPLTTRSNVVSGINNMVFHAYSETGKNILTPEQTHALSIFTNPPRGRGAHKNAYMTQFLK